MTFPAITVGTPILLCVLYGMYWKTHEPVYLQMFRFWRRIFAVGFAVGVVAGIVITFDFGLDWGVFAAKTGPIMDPILGMEVVTESFVEAGFIGILLYGDGRVRPPTMFAAREGCPPGPAPASSPLSRTTLVSLAGLSLAVVAEAGSVGLLGLSGWFIASSAAPWAGPYSLFSILNPGGGVRAFALARIVANCASRVGQHSAALRRIGAARLEFYDRADADPSTHGPWSGQSLDRVMADADTSGMALLPTVALAAGRGADVATLVFLALLCVGVMGNAERLAAAEARALASQANERLKRDGRERPLRAAPSPAFRAAYTSRGLTASGY